MNGATVTSTSWEEADPWVEASLAAALVAVSPLANGVVLRAYAGPVRDAWLAVLGDLLPEGAPVRRIPPGIGDDRLLGGLDLAATLRAGRAIAERGVLAQTDGGILVLAMAECLPRATAARIANVMDCGQVCVERDGLATRAPARFGLVALDEGEGADEHLPAMLGDRLAFHLDLAGIRWCEAGDRFWTRAQIDAARARLESVQVDTAAIATLVGVGARLGIASMRAPLLALGVARTHCALRGGATVEDADLAVAARFVFAPRATSLPEAEPPQSAENQEAVEQEAPEEETTDAGTGPSPEESAPMESIDVVLAAAVAAIPTGLLSQISGGLKSGSKTCRAGTTEGKTSAARRGRPLAARRGERREGRLSLVDTLRAAALWQRLRREGSGSPASPRILVRPQDFRLVRFRERRETTAIFVVDASGSAAFHRLAEVKGAIELLLVDCYVRRNSVALVAFRGKTAEIILPPTRSLARAKRLLAGLPGGGGTPLACGLELGLALADSVRRKGQSPLLVLMTDGRANVGRNGADGRTQAFADALSAGRGIRAAGIATLAIDTSPIFPALAEPPTLRLGQTMNARYIKLPDADAGRVSEAVRAVSSAT